MVILVPNVVFGNLSKHIVFKENKQQMSKGINGLFEATVYLTFQGVVKSKKNFHQCTMENSILY